MKPQLVYWNVKTGFTAYKVCGLWVRCQDSFDSMIICIRQNGQRLFVQRIISSLRRIRARDKRNRANVQREPHGPRRNRRDRQLMAYGA